MEFGSEVLKESGRDGEAANDDAGRYFSPGPEAHHGNVVADIWRFYDLPSVVCAYDRCRASTWSRCWLVSHTSNTDFQRDTYQIPVAKVAIIIIFFVSGICNLHIGTMGRTKIEKSDMTLNIPVAMFAALALKQWPVVIN